MSTIQNPAVDKPYILFAPARYSRIIGYIIAALFFANGLALFVQHGLDHPEVWGLVPLFHFDREQNLPTFFSALMLLLCAGLLIIAARRAKSAGEKHLPWVILSLTFAFLSIDEIASLHEKLDALIHHYTPTSGILHYAWVAPYGAAVVILAILLGPWFFRLSRRLQFLFALSGALYVGGALGVEIISGLYYSGMAETGVETKTLLGDALASIEELGEMTGVALFSYALLTHLCGARGEVRLQFG